MKLFFQTLVILMISFSLTGQEVVKLGTSQFEGLEGIELLKAMESRAGQSTNNDERIALGELIKSQAKIQNDPYYIAIGLHYIALGLSGIGESDTALQIRAEAIERFEALGRKDKMARQFLSVGNILSNLAMYDTAMKAYERSMLLAIESKDSMALTGAYTNIGTIHHEKGNREKELEYLLKALEIGRLSSDSAHLATMLYNLAIFYQESGEIRKSREAAKEAFRIHEAMKSEYGKASIYTLFALQSFEQNDLDSALFFSQKTRVIYTQEGDRSRLALSILNIGEILGKSGKWDRALATLDTAQQMFEELGEKQYAAFVLRAKSASYKELGDRQKAIETIRGAIRIYEELGVYRDLEEWTLDLAGLYERNDDFENAYSTMLEYADLRDSIFSLNRQQAIEDMKTKYETERKQLQIENLEKKAQLQDARIEQEAAQRNLLIGGLIVALLMFTVVGFAFQSKKRDNRIIQEQKKQVELQRDEIEDQRAVLEVKNQEITDSIVYAKRIQSAILPPHRIVKEHLPNSFILYKPKDVVAGDFYWLEADGETVYFAAADCTGHGVPGAMVSVVCVNSLNRSVREFGLTEPGKILDKTRELVIKEFEKSEEEVKDGMDISLCALNTKTGTMQWAGAHNPLWIVRKDSDEIEEIKPDKQPIGQFINATPFRTHDVALNEGDSIYLFSDGYPDQFGGENGKKYKSGNFRKTIARVSKESMDKQHKVLDQEFEQWRGNLEQIDDVCVIGVRV